MTTNKPSREMSPEKEDVLDPEMTSDEDTKDENSVETVINRQNQHEVINKDRQCSQDVSPDFTMRFRTTSPNPMYENKCSNSAMKATPPKRQQRPSERDPSRNSNASGSVFYCCLGCIMVVAVVVGYYHVSFVSSTTIPNKTIKIHDVMTARMKHFSEDLKKIKQMFPSQDYKVWNEIQAGVQEIIQNSKKPWTFVLFSNERQELSCLAEKLGTACSKALNSEDSLVLKPMDLGINYGQAIYNLRPRIIEKKAVVVHDLLNIHPGAIQAFHAMCDRESPLVKEAVYILTVIAPGYNKNETPQKFVENVLHERFVNKVDTDKLQPLITRLTDGPIIYVKPEINGIPCPV